MLREIDTVEAMEELGAELARTATAGDVFVLTGPLGAGKTAFARGFGRELGVSGAITSPTFVISRIHPGSPLNLVHVDAYRLGDSGGIGDLEIEEYLVDSVVLIEWGAHVVHEITDRYTTIEIVRGDDDVRTVTIT